MAIFTATKENTNIGLSEVALESLASISKNSKNNEMKKSKFLKI